MVDADAPPQHLVHLRNGWQLSVFSAQARHGVIEHLPEVWEAGFQRQATCLSQTFNGRQLLVFATWALVEHLPEVWGAGGRQG